MAEGRIVAGNFCRAPVYSARRVKNREAMLSKQLQMMSLNKSIVTASRHSLKNRLFSGRNSCLASVAVFGRVGSKKIVAIGFTLFRFFDHPAILDAFSGNRCMLFGCHRRRGHQFLQLRHIAVIAFSMRIQNAYLRD
jgi:hypothetical protein